MSIDITTDLQHAVEDAAAHLYVWALKDIPQDLRDALADARFRETSVPGRRVLDVIHRNVNVADSEKNLVCQDTGIAVYHARVGEHFPLHPARIYEALRAGTARATVEHPLRSNAVHTITRENTGPNIGYRLPIVHWEFVEDAAAHLYVWALKDIPQDLRDALAAARDRETSTTGKRVLETITRNVEIADDQANLVCQDTGIAVYYCRVGEGFPLHPARIYEALKAGTERATVEHPLRSNTVHTLTRENTGQNVGYRVPIVHWDFEPGRDGLDVKCVPKGSGSENMSFLKMCVPADGVAGIKRFVLDSIVGAGGKPCPPGIVGVGIGGSADYAMHLAKEAIARPVGTHNQDPLVAELETELYELLNETGIGPMGLGGDVTVLSVHVEHADTHMTLNPVAVNYQCWAARRASAHVAADGSVEYERDA